MIRRFAHKGLEGLFFDGTKKGIQPKHAAKLEFILDRLDAATCKEDMRYPGSGLHDLKGDLQGFAAVKVSGNWRVIFRFEGNDAYDVSYLDYH